MRGASYGLGRQNAAPPAVFAAGSDAAFHTVILIAPTTVLFRLHFAA
jgi:hypothetical protein